MRNRSGTWASPEDGLNEKDKVAITPVRKVPILKLAQKPKEENKIGPSNSSSPRQAAKEAKSAPSKPKNNEKKKERPFTADAKDKGVKKKLNPRPEVPHPRENTHSVVVEPAKIDMEGNTMTSPTLSQFVSFSCSEIDISKLEVPEPEEILQPSPKTSTPSKKPTFIKSVSVKEKKEIKVTTPIGRPHRSSSNADSPKPNFLSPKSPTPAKPEVPLTPFEKKEIVNFPEVFFTGNTTSKIKPNALLPNEGFDDENGDYKVVMKDHIGYRYEVIDNLGKGAFGIVCKVLDHKSKKIMALKMIKNRSRYTQQAQVEVKILNYIRMKGGYNTNLVHLTDSFSFRNHFCLVFPLLGENLYEVLKANYFQGFDIEVVRRIGFQLLQGLKFMAKHGILHCDLKPENILLATRLPDTTVSLIDFGSSCFEHDRLFTYIQSRFYRAPEVILGGKYTPSIDMWSFACIIVELFSGFPIFPGENELDQFACIMEVLGAPPESFLAECSRKKYFFGPNGKPRIFENSQKIKRVPGTKPLTECICRYEEKTFIDFLTKCLTWNPKDRLSPAQALAHPFFEPLASSLSSPRLYRTESSAASYLVEGYLNPYGTPYYWDQANPTGPKQDDSQPPNPPEPVSYAEYLQQELEQNFSDASSDVSDSRMENPGLIEADPREVFML